MECPHAYMDRDIEYVLCDKEQKPNRGNRSAVFHSMCSHQVHCPQQNCHKLSSSWLKCVKLAQERQNAFEAIFEQADQTVTDATKKPTRKRTAAQKKE